jgi:DNA adenine methylase
MSPALKPPLKWAGGKRWQVPVIRPLWNAHRVRRLVEPFCGGLAIALGLRPRQALLNDANPHLINFYRHLQHGLRITIPMDNSEALYYRNRARFNALIGDGHADSCEAASIFYYLNRTGYNGLCRFNRSGAFNVPFGKYTRIVYEYDLSHYRAAVGNWVFTVSDFETVPVGPEDFVYADPPYDVPFTQYVRGGFGWADHVRLAHWLATHPGPVILVNQATDRTVRLYLQCDFALRFVAAPRRISCTGDRAPVREVIATRNV